MLSERKTCRLCDSEVAPVLELEPTPIANNFSASPDSNAQRYPLGLTQCTACAHVQQRYVAHGLFSDYKYSTPPVTRPYLEDAAEDLQKRFPKAKTVFEIGCNNGLNLDVLWTQGFIASGIDPVPCTKAGAMQGYFGSKMTWRDDPRFDLIVSNHVFAHVDDLQDVFKAAVSILDGALVFEVQYLPDLVNRCAFDMIYHEHRDHHAINPLRAFVSKYGLTITDVQYVSRQGGSIRLTAQRTGTEVPRVKEEIDWAQFKSAIENKKRTLRDKLKGRKIAAFGASAKACTLIHQCDISQNISCCIDDDPNKWGLYLPGTDIPIVEKASGPVLLLAWNFDVKHRFPEVIMP